ncbi:hypothetical protein [Micromonospora sp. WMMD1155]|uniref:hypothetical protein n=1 Tax=Micromonospora sp. WMMD1155 TaxID=3016094 RepID=UPI00249C4C4B|nr:hypothetical protein [Micromonospora sp. WMMD1155]WFE50813.1 hypothetical protein O7617_10965 [Micromonospora sp. WMMD1155]
MEVAVSGAFRHRDIMKAESITIRPVRPGVGKARTPQHAPDAAARMVADGKNAAAGQQTQRILLFISFIRTTYDCGRDQAVD